MSYRQHNIPRKYTVKTPRLTENVEINLAEFKKPLSLPNKENAVKVRATSAYATSCRKIAY